MKFQAIKAPAWRAKRYHRVHNMLQTVWRECLTNREKYEFWFNLFNTQERVRLWNVLVFTREWFRRVVYFSRRQKNYKDAVAEQEKLNKKAKLMKNKAEAKEKKKEKDKKDGKVAVEEEDPEEDDLEESGKKDDRSFYKGFHRRDVNDLLKEYAKEMFSRGVRSEELLLIKVKPDQAEAVVEREHLGGTTSFFNADTKKDVKKEEELMNKYLDLTEEEELQQAREVFTSDEMLKIWNQFFIGTYMVEDKRKDADNTDKEDGLDA